MPKARLTVTNVRTLPAIDGKRTDYVDALLPGFVLRVSPTGARSYGLAVKHRGRKLRITFGKLRDLQLGEARDRARTILRQLERGERPERPTPVLANLTVAELVERCISERPLRLSTRELWRRLLIAEIQPVFGARAAEDLGRLEIRDWLRAIRKRSGHTANNAFALLRRAYSWGRREDLVQLNPCEGIPTPFKVQASERVLSAEELWALMRTLDRAGPRWAAYADVTLLLLLTGVRRAAALGTQRSELEDLEGRDPRWIVPTKRSKSGRPHVVPLSSAAIAVLRRRLELMQGDRLFPRAFSGRWRIWLRRRVALAVRARRRLGGLPTGEVPRWTIHGLRHTMATHLREDLGVAPDVVSLILGHTIAGPNVTRIYDRAELLPERRRVLEAWAAWLKALQAPPEGAGRVLRFPRG